MKKGVSLYWILAAEHMFEKIISTRPNKNKFLFPRGGKKEKNLLASRTSEFQNLLARMNLN